MKRKNILEFFILAAITIMVAVLGSWTFLKFDLTQEKRHTLTESSIDMLSNLDDDFYIRCYLHGDFPANFINLEKAIKERLDEFADFSDGKVSYEFIDPYESEDASVHKETEAWLYDQGLEFTRLSYMEGGVKNYSNIWPGVILNYKGREMPLMLFKSNLPEPTDEMINSSINNLEYELTGAMRTMLNELRQTIGILEGHGELSDLEIFKFEQALKETYDVEKITLNGQLEAMSLKPDAMRYRVNKHDALIIAQPTEEIEFQDRLLIDQYIMNGGKVLWMVDPIKVDLDSLRINQFTMGTSNELGIYNMLFEYGVRLNRDIIIDFNCSPIAMDAGPLANQRGIELYPWYFSPLVKERSSSHPVASNLDDIFFEFASTMDFVGDDPEISKTVLLSSGELSKTFKAPIRVSPDIVSLDKNYFEVNSDPYKPMAVLLEGKFKSAFTNRIGGDIKNDPVFGFREIGVDSKMIVISDGDIAKNSYKPDGKGGYLTYPLGYNRYADAVIYDNGEFLLNAMNYLLDDDALISIRSRNIELRKLNNSAIIGNKFKWQIINVVFPLIIILIIGLLLNYLRRKKYSKLAS